MPFNQMMNFPVELSLRNTPSGIRLCPVPIREIGKLYKKKRKYTDTTLKPGTNLLDGFNAELLDIDLHIKSQEARKIGFRIRDMEIVYDAKAKLLCSGEERASVRTIDGMVKLRLLVDRTSIEVYANEGEVCLPLGAVPGENAGKRLELYAEGGNAEIVKLTVRELKSVWRDE